MAEFTGRLGPGRGEGELDSEHCCGGAIRINVGGEMVKLKSRRARTKNVQRGQYAVISVLPITVDIIGGRKSKPESRGDCATREL